MARLLGPDLGFRVVFLAGEIAGLVVLPLVIRFLSESLVHLRSQGRFDEARRWAGRLGLDAALASTPMPEAEETGGRFAVLFSRRHRTMTVLFSLVTFLALLVFFGLYT